MAVKYEVRVKDGSWKTGLSQQEIKELVDAGEADGNSECCRVGDRYVLTIGRIMPRLFSQGVIIEESESELDKYSKILITREMTLDGYRVVKRFDMISAESAFGMNLFLDFLTGIRDVVGGQSRATQDILAESKAHVFNSLKKQAYDLGATHVIGAHMNHGEISGQGKSMLLVTAFGTPVVLERIEEKVSDL